MNDIYIYKRKKEGKKVRKKNKEMPSRMLKTEWGEFGYKMTTEIITRKKRFKRKRKM